MTIGYYAVDAREVSYGLKDRQFLLSLQPIINIEEESFETLEVFIRWKHPLLGMLPPSLFMPRISTPELQNAMTDYIIQEAVNICRLSESSGKPIGVNININANELYNEGTLRAIRRETFEISDAGNICFELNPRILTKFSEEVGIHNYYPDLPPSQEEMKHLQSVKLALTPYERLGITLTLDTYDHLLGALDRAKILGLHAVKISPKVIASAHLDEKNYLQKASDKAKEYNIALIATGVESLGHMKSIINAGINYAQGMFFCSPVFQQNLCMWNKENLYEAKRVTNMLQESRDDLHQMKTSLREEQEKILSQMPLAAPVEKKTIRDVMPLEDLIVKETPPPPSEASEDMPQKTLKNVSEYLNSPQAAGTQGHNPASADAAHAAPKFGGFNTTPHQQKAFGHNRKL